jgi:hypothetical protein
MWFDNKILTLCQRLAEEIQVSTGKNCYYVAYVCNWFDWFSFVALGLYMSVTYSSPPNIGVAGIFFVCYSLSVHFSAARLYDWSKTDQPKTSHLSSFGIGALVASRLCLLISVVVCLLLLNFLFAMWIFFHVAGNYFEDCKPLPPGSRKFLRSARLANA